MQDFSVLAWNVQGIKYRLTHTPFEKILPRLAGGVFDIICLEEMLDAVEKLKTSEQFGPYHLFIPRLNKTSDGRAPSFNHNVLLSKFPILATEELSFSSLQKKVHIENCTRADIKIGKETLRIYICHFAIGGVGMATRLEQLKLVLSDAAHHKGPAVICGDMNVTIPRQGLKRRAVTLWHQEPAAEMRVSGRLVVDDERELFYATAREHGFDEALDLKTPTWSPFKTGKWELFGLKLDWFMVRDLTVKSAALGEYISDHRPVEVQCRI